MRKPSAYELATHKGRQADEASSPGYCGSCGIETHCTQVRDPKSWVHSSIKRWEKLGGWGIQDNGTSESRIDLDSGKYTVIHNNGVGLHALRHGAPWRSLLGDGLVLAMAQEIESLREAEIDRDIKAANLQLLVEKVLDYKEAVESAVGGPDHIDTYEAERLLDDTVALARSLKQ